MEDLSERIAIILNYSGLKAPSFAKAIGCKTQQSVYDLMQGKTKSISSDMQNKILSYIPELSRDWLLYGEGEMLKASSEEERTDGKEIPLLPINAIGGSLGEFSAAVMPHECEMLLAPIKGADMAITIAGDSMFPQYPSGSVVLIKKINEKAFIEWGNVYVLDTVNGTIIKRVQPGDDEGYIICESINDFYKPYKVKLSDIMGFYRVLMCMIRA